MENLFDFLGTFFIVGDAKKGQKIQFKHNKNKKYRQLVCSIIKAGPENDLMPFDYVAYSLDENTIEVLVLTTLIGSGRGLDILGII